MMAKQKSKVGEMVKSLLGFASFAGFILLLPLSAVGSFVWVFVSATTPDIYPLLTAILLGALIGIVVVALCVGVMLRASGDAFPDFVTGVLMPCGVIIFVSCILQPVVARATQNRLRKLHPPSSIAPRPSNTK